ncbi:unnamed protein product [Larinioides sclopetarius]|uniref:Saposin B-type domain-containing protein n=1 Tax=Larinioides sclopetarius TaxID=280406 RepID=A0AAV1Z849_9ARAC
MGLGLLIGMTTNQPTPRKVTAGIDVSISILCFKRTGVKMKKRLLDLANSFCEVQLKKHCECIIKHGITVENVAMLCAMAIKYCAKELEEFCFGFALNHLTAVNQTEAFNKLEEPTIKNFIVKAARHGALSTDNEFELGFCNIFVSIFLFLFC